jgi:anaerobic ribonucleoside-triphosphate reductase activating protein
MDSAIDLKNFNYIKLGPYIEERGPLSSPTTNQHLLKVFPDLTLSDITYRLTK